MSSSPTEVTTAVTMPQMGVSVAEGTIVEWRKRPGERVEADEMICEITTDKIDVEVPSPAGGRLVRILAEPGDVVPVGEPIAEIGEGEDERSNVEGSADSAAAAVEEIDRSRFYSPVVRRIAAEHEIDLEQVKGTGVGGRVRKSDLLAVIAAGAEKRREEPVLHSESPYRPEPLDGTVPAAGGRREPLSPMRKAIAGHMLESRRTSAHCTTIVEADFSAVEAARTALRDRFARRGVRLTPLSFVALAVVEALERFPRLNCSLDGDELVYHDAVHLGIAVALEDGLVVPVIRAAERLSLEGLAAAIADAATRARDGRLDPDEVHGGTFTITNPGRFGAIAATPIINQPQVAILDLEAIVRRPIVVEAADGAEAIAIRPIANLCMSWDHRALDGADAARFLAAVRERIESWEAGR